MPFRCTTCQAICKSDAPPEECETRNKCEFEQVAVIHGMHPDGPGRKVARQKQLMSGPDKSETVMTPLKLCCDSTKPDAHRTEFASGVTCMKCREWLEQYAVDHPVEVEE